MEIPEEMGLSATVVDTLRSLYKGQQASVRPVSETADLFRLLKRVGHKCLMCRISSNSIQVVCKSADKLVWIGITMNAGVTNNRISLHYVDDIVLTSYYNFINSSIADRQRQSVLRDNGF